MKMLKKLLTIIMCLTLLFSNAVLAFADELPESELPAEEAVAEEADLPEAEPAAEEADLPAELADLPEAEAAAEEADLPAEAAAEEADLPADLPEAEAAAEEADLPEEGVLDPEDDGDIELPEMEDVVASVLVTDFFMYEGDTGVETADEGTFNCYYCYPQEITVTMADGKVFSGDPWDVLDEINETYDLDLEWTIETDQAPGNEWGVGTHAVAFELEGAKTTYNVEIKPSPVVSVEILKGKFSYYDTEDGWYDGDDAVKKDAGIYFPELPEQIRVKLSDGTTLTGSTEAVLDRLYEKFEYAWGYFTEDGEAYWDTDQSPENPWGVGTHNADFHIWSASTQHPIEIVKSPILSVSAAPVKVHEGYNQEETWDELDEDGNPLIYKYYYALPEELTVGTQEQEFKGSTDDVYDAFTEKFGLEPQFLYFNDEHYGKTWDIGTHEAVIVFGGERVEYEVEIVKHLLEHVEAVAPTADDPGHIEYWYCSVCNKYFSDEAGTQEISVDDTVLPPIEDDIPVEGFEIKENEIEIPATKTFALTPVFTPENATNKNITWTSSNTKAATVDENGVVTGKTVGKTTITAVTEDGNFKDTCEVNVLFSDVTDKSKANFEAIYYLVNKGVIAGFKNGEYFAPNDECTRGQVVLFLWRAAGKPKPKTSTLTFKDAADIEKLGPQYKQAVLWGNENGVVMGFTSGANKGKFMPNDTCTRAQIVLFLYRFAGMPATKATKLTFKDTPEIEKMAPAYTKAILCAVEKKITTGYKVSGGYAFKPNQNCTRGECATFIYRAVK